jgi:CrcB protein
MTVVLVALAGAVGAVLRYAVDRTVQRRTRSDAPVGIAVVNLTGSFALGLVTGLAARHGWSVADLAVVGTGLIGSYTTFSTFAYDGVALAEQGRWRTFSVNLVGSLVLGLGAAGAGIALGSL